MPCGLFLRVFERARYYRNQLVERFGQSFLCDEQQGAEEMNTFKALNSRDNSPCGCSKGPTPPLRVFERASHHRACCERLKNHFSAPQEKMIQSTQFAHNSPCGCPCGCSNNKSRLARSLRTTPARRRWDETVTSC